MLNFPAEIRLVCRFLVPLEGFYGKTKSQTHSPTLCK